MSVHYKFKSTLNFDTITFDGLHISVGDLKREIVHQKRLGKITDFDLQITNAQTKEEYKDDAYLIPKNTTLIISRVPIVHQLKKGWETQTDNSVSASNTTKQQDNANLDLFKMKGSEEDKIQAMMLQSTADYDPKTYHRIRGQSQIGEVPATYRCNKCKKGGHWIKNCPFNIGKEQIDVKRNTGIPRSFRDKVEISQNTEKGSPLPVEEKQEVPEDLLCGICNDLFVDAVMIPCCGSSFCDDCVRTALLESDENECPDCKEKGCSPGSLIPNRFLRNSVNVFKNETGYKTAPLKTVTIQPKSEEVQTNSSEKVDEVQVELEPPEVEEVDPPTNTHVETEEDAKISPETAEPIAAPEIDTEKAPDEIAAPVEKEIPTTTADGFESDDDDDNDNITVTMPPKQQLKNNIEIHQNHIHNGRNMRHPKPPGIESSPHKTKESSSHEHIKRSPQRIAHLETEYASQSNRNQVEQQPAPIYKINENQKMQNERIGMPPNQMMGFSNYQNQGMHERMEKPPMNHMDIGQSHMHRMNYKPVQTMAQLPQGPPVHMQHSMPPYNIPYNEMGHRPIVGYPPYNNNPHHIHNPRPGYVPMREIHLSTPQTFPSSNLASIYQGVAAKVGTGVIDDPLEAFNRIMKEKEKQKEERRRTPERRRSRSVERQQRGRFRSPAYERRPVKEMNVRDKREWSREKERRREPPPYDRRLKRDVGYSTRGSTSPSDKRIRPTTQQRSPPPNQKAGYNLPSPERKPLHGYEEPKIESLEPPPPGFESVQAVQLAHKNVANNGDGGKHMRSTTPNANKKYSREFDNFNKKETMPEKRSWSRANNKNIDKNNKNARSLTPPPPKPKIIRTANKSNDFIEKNQIIPARERYKENEQNKFDEKAREQLPHKGREERTRERNSPPKVRRENIDESGMLELNDSQLSKNDDTNRLHEHHNIGEKDVDLKDDRRIKDRKKKKKEKSERKKSRKDKKEKREKVKKSNSPNDDEDTLNEHQSDKDIRSPQYQPTHFENVEANKFDSMHPEKTSVEHHNTIIIANADIEKVPNTENAAVDEQRKDAKDFVDQHKQILDSGRMENVKARKFSLSNNELEHSPSAEFKRLDSVLDIEGYDTDFDDNNHQNVKSKSLQLEQPQISKWERDDQSTADQPQTLKQEETIDDKIYNDDGTGIVTNEVLRKAENAIFARAINAIRPTTVDFKITIPTSNSQERAVAIKHDSKRRSPSPKTSKSSIKDRLGSKVVGKQTNSSRDSSDNKRKSSDITFGDNKHHDRPLNKDRNKKPPPPPPPSNQRSRYKSKEKDNNDRGKYFRKFDSRDRDVGGPDNYCGGDLNNKKLILGCNDSRSQSHRRYSRERKDPPHSNRGGDKRMHRTSSGGNNKESDYDNRSDKNSRFSIEKKNPADEYKHVECRTVVSIASKPSKPIRPENPFRKFEKVENRNISINYPKIQDSVHNGSSESLDSQSNDEKDDQKRKKHRKDKKSKKRAKLSSTDSLDNSERKKHIKSKKRSKSEKKKKKTKK